MKIHRIGAKTYRAIHDDYFLSDTGKVVHLSFKEAEGERMLLLKVVHRSKSYRRYLVCMDDMYA